MTLDSRIAFLIGGIFFSSVAQISMKQATVYAGFGFHWFLLICISVFSYFFSFVMYYFALKYFPISKVSPVMTIGVVVVVVSFGLMVGETVSSRQLLGIALGVVSIFFLLS